MTRRFRRQTPTTLRPGRAAAAAVPGRAGPVLLLVALLAGACPARAEQTGTEPAPPRGHPEVRCPPAVAVEERAPEPPAGWSVHRAKIGHRFAGVTFYDGPPDEDASLKYDDTVTRGDEWIATWHFPPHERGYWIVCRYEATALELARALPSTVSVCHVSYDKRIVTDPRHDEVRRLECE